MSFDVLPLVLEKVMLIVNVAPMSICNIWSSHLSNFPSSNKIFYIVAVFFPNDFL